MIKKIVAVAIGFVLTGWFTFLRSERLPFFERKYLNAYIRVSAISLGSTYDLPHNTMGDLAVPGDDPIRFIRVKADRTKLKTWLRENIYNGQPLWRVFELPLLAGLLCLCLFLVLANKIENRSQSTLIRGPKVVSKWAFWKRSRHGLYVRTRYLYLFWLKLYIPENRLSHHSQIVGVSGTCKSSIARDLVRQAKRRGWPCVFTDLSGEYFNEFYEEGDYLIDFKDERCPRWMIGREALDEPSAMPLGEGAFPDEPHRTFFFQDHARAILAYIEGVHHYSTSELSKVLINEDLLDGLLKGTEHAGTIKKNSPEQRNGIIGTLNHLGRPMRWMPDEEGRREFCVREWAEAGINRRGSIFLRSTALTFPALRPLHSLILDLCLLGTMTYPGPCLFVLDEIGEFQRCPQYRRAITMSRKAGVVILSSYQGFTQLRKIYGSEDAETIMSGHYTNIVLATNGEESTKYSSALLGLPAEVKRGRASTSRRALDTPLSERVSMMQETTMVTPVTPGQIQRQPDGHGFMAQRGVIVPIHVDYLPPLERNIPLIERVFPAPEPRKKTIVQWPIFDKPHKSKYTRSHEPTEVSH